MGKTVDDIQDLREFAQQMGATTAFSAAEAAEGLNVLAMAGLEAEEQIAALPDVLNLAAAGAISMENAASYTVGAVKGFSDEMGNAHYYADLIAKGATLANTSVEGLGAALSRSAATASSYGQEADSVTLSLLRLANQNVTGEAAATALNRAMSDLYTPTASAKKALTELGVSAYDVTTGAARDFNDVVADLSKALSGMKDEQANAYAATIFTTQGLNAFNKMTAATDETMQKFTAGLADIDGSAAQQAATQLNNLAGDITMFQSALGSAQIVLNDQLTPSLREFVQFGTAGISTLTDAFKEGGFAGAMEALGGILSDGLNMIVEQIPDFMDAGMQLLGALGQGIIDNLPTITSAALTVALMLVNGLVSAFPALTEGGTQLLLQLALGIAEAVPELIPAIVSAVFEIVNTLTSPDTLTALLGAALAIILALGDGLIEALPDLIAAIPVIVQNLATALAAAAPEIVAAGVHLFGSLVSNLPAILVAILSAVPAIVQRHTRRFQRQRPRERAGRNIPGRLRRSSRRLPQLRLYVRRDKHDPRQHHRFYSKCLYRKLGGSLAEYPRHSPGHPHHHGLRSDAPHGAAIHRNSGRNRRCRRIFAGESPVFGRYLHRLGFQYFSRNRQH